MKNKPKFTIVTVTYNVEEFLEKTIKSVINQDFKDIEYIIIDGKSTDKTVDIIKKYEKYLSYWVSEPDKNLYDAMNKGIEKANGEWIHFLNAGDTYANSKVISFVEDKIEKDIDFIYGTTKMLREDGTSCNWVPVDMSYILETMPCGHPSLFVRTGIMKKYKFNTFYQIGADFDFLHKLYAGGYKYKYFNTVFANFILGGASNAEPEITNVEGMYIAMQYLKNAKDFYKNSFYKNFLKKSLENRELPSSIFYHSFNIVLQEIEKINKKYTNIILYGNSSLAKIISKFLTIDYKIADLSIEKNDGILISPKDINQYEYEAIFITLLGREDMIEDFLISIQIPENKIKKLNF